jgi:hypothetical protein
MVTILDTYAIPVQDKTTLLLKIVKIRDIRHRAVAIRARQISARQKSQTKF